MAWNLSNFKNNIHSLARKQYFIVRIPPLGESETLTALCRTTSMPALTIETVPVPFRGIPLKIADKPTFADWTVSFLCDEAHTLRNTCLQWMSKVYNVQTLQNASHNEYLVDGVSVSQLSSNGDITATCVFRAMFPTSVTEIGFSHDGGEIQTFDVTFSYADFVMNSLKGDVVQSNVDIDVDETGRFKGVSIEGIAGVKFEI
jgi:hypothetical protein